MKFLCVPCDRPMTLERTAGPDRGSMTLVYACPACGYEMAMLTNAHETQVVGSLGVTVGPGGERRAGESKCPFTGMVRELSDAGASPEAAAAPAGPPPQPAAAGASAVGWTAAARQRMERLPEFVRPMVAMGVERFARDRGYRSIDDRVLDEARAHFEV